MGYLGCHTTPIPPNPVPHFRIYNCSCSDSGGQVCVCVINVWYLLESAQVQVSLLGQRLLLDVER